MCMGDVERTFFQRSLDLLCTMGRFHITTCGMRMVSGVPSAGSPLCEGTCARMPISQVFRPYRCSTHTRSNPCILVGTNPVPHPCHPRNSSRSHPKTDCAPQWGITAELQCNVPGTNLSSRAPCTLCLTREKHTRAPRAWVAEAAIHVNARRAGYAGF